MKAPVRYSTLQAASFSSHTQVLNRLHNNEVHLINVLTSSSDNSAISSYQLHLCSRRPSAAIRCLHICYTRIFYVGNFSLWTFLINCCACCRQFLQCIFPLLGSLILHGFLAVPICTAFMRVHQRTYV